MILDTFLLLRLLCDTFMQIDHTFKSTSPNCQFKYKSIFLGQSVPIENLEPLIASNEFVEFIAYVTVEPSKEKIDKYLQKFKKKILDKKDCRLSLLGFQTQFVYLNTKPENVSVYRGFEDLIEALNL